MLSLSWEDKFISKVPSKSDAYRINSAITVRQVRLIGADGEVVGVLATHKALQMATEADLDLVEVAPSADPPVCKILDYGKFIYEQTKKAAIAKKNQKQVSLKEIKFRPVTEEGDIQVKLRNLIRFLSEGDKVKITVRFRGREINHQEFGMALLERIQQELLPYGQVEQPPKREGRQLSMMLAPKKTA